MFDFQQARWLTEAEVNKHGNPVRPVSLDRGHGAAWKNIANALSCPLARDTEETGNLFAQ